MGSVSFRPDASKGNSSTLEPSGDIGPDGTYKLSTNGKPGAPLGWYKVIVAADVPSNPNDPYSMPKSIIGTKYADPNRTDLSIEVVEDPSPEAYDLRVSKYTVRPWSQAPRPRRGLTSSLFTGGHRCLL
jgi:hypothetical protein